MITPDPSLPSVGSGGILLESERGGVRIGTVQRAEEDASMHLLNRLYCRAVYVRT
jgi:hypothetical protein